MNTNISDPSLALASAICNAIAGALTRVCNTEWQFSEMDEGEEQGEPAASGEYFAIAFGSPLDGRCILRVASSEGAEKSTDSKERPELTGSEAGPFFTAMREAAEALKKLVAFTHSDIQIEVTRLSADAWPAEKATNFGARFNSVEAQLVVHIFHEAALLKVLHLPVNQAIFAATVIVPQPQANLELVMDVSLNVTLRFGRRQLPLREIIDLTSGSVVELDRQVDEPVELVLDGRVVARGEAVVIDGNYGMRVTQIVHPLLNA